MARLTPTWVYAITCGDHTKIGIATDVGARLRGLQGGNPYAVAVFGTRLFGGYSLARQIEKELHAEFAAVRGYGEWFRIDPEQVMASLCRREESHMQLAESGAPPTAKPARRGRHPGWTDAEWRIAKAVQF